MVKEESDLIEQARSGNMNAFETIYRNYSGMVYSVTCRITGNVPDAEEAVQDTFIDAHKALKAFRGDSSLKTWLYRIAVNRALNMVKKSQRIRTREQLFDHDVNPDDMPNNIDQAIDNDAAKTKADELLSALDPDKRACLTLRAVEGLSYAEIGIALGININTVRTRLKRAREALLNLRNSGENL